MTTVYLAQARGAFHDKIVGVYSDSAAATAAALAEQSDEYPYFRVTAHNIDTRGPGREVIFSQKSAAAEPKKESP